MLLSLSRRSHRSSAPRAMICLFLSTRYAGGVSDMILSNEMKGKNLVSSQLKRVAYAELAREGTFLVCASTG